MKKYEIKYYPDPILRKIAQPITGINNNIKTLINNMSEIMYFFKAIGLAAPQIGVKKRVIVADIGDGLNSMINPRIISGYGNAVMREGCLSLPEKSVPVYRKDTIIVKYLDLNEKEIEAEFSGIKARVIQHEIDHLNGILIIDYPRLSADLAITP